MHSQMIYSFNYTQQLLLDYFDYSHFWSPKQFREVCVVELIALKISDSEEMVLYLSMRNYTLISNRT